MVASNDLNISQSGFVTFDGISTFSGRTLIAGSGVSITNANGVSGNPTISVSGSSVGQTITGDTGGALSPTGGNWNILSKATAGFSTSFSGSVSTLSFNTTDAFLNTLIGNLAGNASLATAGAANTGLGSGVLHALTTGVSNVALGYVALTSVQSGSRNTAVGFGCLSQTGSTTITDNVAVGYSAGGAILNNGIQNTLVGSFAGDTITTGRNNICLGYNAANAYISSESSNILIGSVGVVAESNVIRIGTQGAGTGQQNTCYVAGVTGVTVAASAPTAVDTNGQLSSLGFGSSTQVLTSNGAGVSPTWQAASGGSSTSFSVAMNSAQTITQGALVKVIYDTVLIDTASGYSGGTYTIPTTGNWFISVVGNFSTSVSFIACDIFINKNVGTYLLHLQPSTPSDGVTINNGSGSGVFAFTAGDTVEIDVFGITTGSVNLAAQAFSNGYFNVFSGYKLP